MPAYDETLIGADDAAEIARAKAIHWARILRDDEAPETPQDRYDRIMDDVRAAAKTNSIIVLAQEHAEALLERIEFLESQLESERKWHAKNGI